MGGARAPDPAADAHELIQCCLRYTHTHTPLILDILYINAVSYSIFTLSAPSSSYQPIYPCKRHHPRSVPDYQSRQRLARRVFHSLKPNDLRSVKGISLNLLSAESEKMIMKRQLTFSKRKADSQKNKERSRHR